MKKRIIDNHTMKVMVTREDLKQHGITALDLLGDHNQIENFFYKVLNEVDPQHIFSSHKPLTFRVIPNDMGLDIIISYRINDALIKRQTAINNSALTNKKLNHNVIKLSHFEDFVKISNLLKIQHGISRLYHYEGHYYLELSFSNHLTKAQQDIVKNKLSVAYEYGMPTTVSQSELQGHGKVIMKSNALAQGRYYFH